MHGIPVNKSMAVTRSRAWTRPAFSLVELMIAIGILGVGMLMVASTFPVGISQTRVAANETVAPMVAHEGFNTLHMLLKEDIARFATDDVYREGLPTLTGSFRLRDLVLGTASYRPPNAPSATPSLTHFLYPSSNIGNNKLKKANALSLNDWLRRLGEARSYPSDGSAGDAPPFSWAVLFRNPLVSGSTSVADTSRLEVLLYVLRRNTDPPFPTELKAPTKTALGYASSIDTRDPYGTRTKAIQSLGTGRSVIGPKGDLFPPVARLDAEKGVVYFDSAPPDFGGGTVWIIPKDPATGISPMVGDRLYKHIIPVN